MPNRFQLEREIDRAMRGDRYRFRRQLRELGELRNDDKSPDGRLAQLVEAVRRSVALRENAPPRRAADFTTTTICRSRPNVMKSAAPSATTRRWSFAARRARASRPNCRRSAWSWAAAIDGLIGHTQPRRIAARSVAARIAEELASPLGRDVGFKVRFAEALSPQTLHQTDDRRHPAWPRPKANHT